MHVLLILGLVLAAPAQSLPHGSVEELTTQCFHNSGDALSACDEAIFRSPSSRPQPYLLLAKGMMLSNSKENAMASAVIRQAISSAPKDAYAHLIDAWAEDQAGNRQLADNQYAEAVKLGITRAEEIQTNEIAAKLIRNIGGQGDFLYRVAQGFERTGQKQIAKSFYLASAEDFEHRPDPKVIDAFGGAMRVDPLDGATHYRLAQFWSHWDDTHGAEIMRQMEEAVRLAPDDPDYHFALAQLYKTKNETKKAVEQYHEALRLKPDFAEAKHEVDLAMMSSGEVAAAAAEASDSEEALNQLHDCVEQNGIRGETGCRSALKIGLSLHNAAVAHLFLAEELSGSDASEEYRTAIQADPAYALAYYLFALRASGSPAKTARVPSEEPIVLFETAAKLRPDWVAPRQQLATLLWSHKRYAEAKATLREAVALDPADDSLSATLKEWNSESFSNQGQVKSVASQLQAKPDDPQLHQRFAEALASAGREDEARNEYRLAYKLDPQNGLAIASDIMYTGFADVACDIYAETRMKASTSIPQSALESDLEACFRMFPAQTKFLAQLAAMQLGRGDGAAARRSYEQIVKIDAGYFDKHPEERQRYDRSKMQRGPK